MSKIFTNKSRQAWQEPFDLTSKDFTGGWWKYNHRSFGDYTNYLGYPGIGEINFPPYRAGGLGLLGHQVAFSVVGPTIKTRHCDFQWELDLTSNKIRLDRSGNGDLYSPRSESTSPYPSIYGSASLEDIIGPVLTGTNLYAVLNFENQPIGDHDGSRGRAVAKDKHSYSEIFKIDSISSEDLQLHLSKNLSDYFDPPANGTPIVRSIMLLTPASAPLVAVPGGENKVFAILPPERSLVDDLQPSYVSHLSDDGQTAWNGFALLSGENGHAEDYNVGAASPVEKPVSQGYGGYAGSEFYDPSTGTVSIAAPVSTNGWGRVRIPLFDNPLGELHSKLKENLPVSVPKVGQVLHIYDVSVFGGASTFDTGNGSWVTDPGTDWLLGYHEVVDVDSQWIEVRVVRTMNPDTGVPFFPIPAALALQSWPMSDSGIVISWTIHPSVEQILDNRFQPGFPPYLEYDFIDSARIKGLIPPTFASGLACFDIEGPGNLNDLGFKAVLYHNGEQVVNPDDLGAHVDYEAGFVYFDKAVNGSEWRISYVAKSTVPGQHLGILQNEDREFELAFRSGSDDNHLSLQPAIPPTHIPSNGFLDLEPMMRGSFFNYWAGTSLTWFDSQGQYFSINADYPQKAILRRPENYRAFWRADAISLPDQVYGGNTKKTSFLESVGNEVLWSSLFTNRIIEGAQVQGLFSNLLQISEATALWEGRTVLLDATELNVSDLSDGKRTLYLDENCQYRTSAFPISGLTPIASLETTSGVISALNSTIGGRKFLDDRHVLTVGQGHFATIYDAVEWVKVRPGRTYTIEVVSDTVEVKAPIKVDFKGLTIIGNSTSTVSWSGNKNLFEFFEADGTVIRGLNILHTNAGASLPATITRIAFRFDGGAQNCVIEGCSLDYVTAKPQAFLFCAAQDTEKYTRWTVQNNHAKVSETGIYFGGVRDAGLLGPGFLEDIVIENNRLEGVTPPASPILKGYDDTLISEVAGGISVSTRHFALTLGFGSSIHIRENTISGFQEAGVFLYSSYIQSSVTKNTVMNTVSLDGLVIKGLVPEVQTFTCEGNSFSNCGVRIAHPLKNSSFSNNKIDSASSSIKGDLTLTCSGNSFINSDAVFLGSVLVKNSFFTAASTKNIQGSFFDSCTFQNNAVLFLFKANASVTNSRVFYLSADLAPNPVILKNNTVSNVVAPFTTGNGSIVGNIFENSFELKATETLFSQNKVSGACSINDLFFLVNSETKLVVTENNVSNELKVRGHDSIVEGNTSDSLLVTGHRVLVTANRTLNSGVASFIVGESDPGKAESENVIVQNNSSNGSVTLSVKSLQYGHNRSNSIVTINGAESGIVIGNVFASLAGGSSPPSPNFVILGNMATVGTIYGESGSATTVPAIIDNLNIKKQ